MSDTPVYVNRTKTLILEANEKQSSSYTAGSYETILNKGIEINNGDVISLESAFVDTSQINPDNIFLKDDVNITWNNGIYLVNQQLITMCPSSAIGAKKVITDNNPIILSRYQAKGVSDVVLWTTCKMRRANGAFPNWGGVNIQYNVRDANNQLRTVMVFMPAQSGGSIWGGEPEAVWNINIVGLRSSPPVAIDPGTGRPVGPTGYAFSEGDASVGFITVPIVPGSQAFEEIDTGTFTPVINEGSFIVPSGTYEPTHLAKVLTDGFDRLDSSRDYQNPVARTSQFPFAFANNAPGPISNPTTVIGIDDGFKNLPFDWSLNALVGWTANFSYRSNNLPADQDGQIIHVAMTVVESDPSDIAGEFRIQNPVVPFATAPLYPAGGQQIVILTPPAGYYDKGSAFLQSTENYTIKGVDALPIYAMVDCLNHRNVFTWDLTGNYSWIGSNNVEVSWDPDQKRFRFNYMHFPLSTGAGPAIINQVSYNFNEDAGASPVIPASYYRSYEDDSINMTSKAYGGIFFTSLEPFNSFWQQTLGFESSLIADFKAPFSSFPSDTATQGIPFSGLTPVFYEDVSLPSITLTPGVNITEQLFVLGDLTGTPKDYTGAGYAPYSLTAAPNDGAPGAQDGRVAVSIDDVVPVIAGLAQSIGKQSSGYYIVDIDVGTTYNESIGSDTRQESYSRNIRGVIDRYYSANSYTSSQGSQISYVHYGNSFLLGNIKVRFKNSDGTDITDLGRDNTIFLKVIKENQINISPDPVNPDPTK